MVTGKKQALESALRILGIKYSKSDSENMLERTLKGAFSFPVSQTEWEIKRTIESLIKNACDPTESRKSLYYLKELVSYSSWD